MNIRNGGVQITGRHVLPTWYKFVSITLWLSVLRSQTIKRDVRLPTNMEAHETVLFVDDRCFCEGAFLTTKEWNLQSVVGASLYPAQVAELLARLAQDWSWFLVSVCESVWVRFTFIQYCWACVNLPRFVKQSVNISCSLDVECLKCTCMRTNDRVVVQLHWFWY